MEPFLIKDSGLKISIFIKNEIPAQAFFCEYCETYNCGNYAFPTFCVMIELFGRF